MFNIDFGTLPEASRKNISPEEITSLNGLFQDPTIQKQLEDIEEQRKIRQNWKYVIYGWCTILALTLSYIFWTWENIFSRLISGLFFTIGTWDDAFAPVIWSTIGSYSLGIGFLYSKFSSKIEIPLKSEVLQKMCPILYSKLEYSYDGKYSFDEVEDLRSKKFIDSYDSMDRVEDSVHFDIEKDWKIFSVNGFELETSEVRGSGKNRRRVTTNHCYLMRAAFPHARIPLSSDLLITHDIADSWLSNKLIFPILGLFFWTTISLVILSLVIINSWTLIFTSLMIGGCIWYSIHYFYQKNINTNRVQLENMEFEKLFDVKCEDQVTSRMIITPAFMDRIISFVNKTGNSYEFLLRDNIMYIKRQIKGNYLEAWTEKNMLTNLAWFTQFYADMREIIQFTYDMNLMYLSKTDTTKSIENNGSIIHQVTPIAFTNQKNSKTWIIGWLLTRYVLKT